DEGKGFRQPDEAERKWVLGDRVNLPGDDHTLNLSRQRDREVAQEEPGEIADPEGCIRVLAQNRRVFHERARLLFPCICLFKRAYHLFVKMTQLSIVRGQLDSSLEGGHGLAVLSEKVPDTGKLDER